MPVPEAGAEFAQSMIPEEVEKRILEEAYKRQTLGYVRVLNPEDAKRPQASGCVPFSVTPSGPAVPALNKPKFYSLKRHFMIHSGYASSMGQRRKSLLESLTA